MKKRVMAMILALILLLGCISAAFAAEVQPSDLTYNQGTRHELCAGLSEQAVAYYKGDNAPEKLLALPGSDSKSSLKTADSELYQALHALMSSTMTDSVTYSELTSYWRYTDTAKGEKEAVLFYSDFAQGGYNREHVWPKSHASYLQQNGGCDLHHLRPTASSVNSTRGNYTMGNVVGILPEYEAYEYGGKEVLWLNKGESMVEIADNVKGDVARIFLYVYCRWEQPNLFEDVAEASLPPMDPDDYENDGKRVIENLDTLLYWMEIDPVDSWEMSRNDRIEDVQGNRNVFIDYPELAWLLFDEPLPNDYETPSGYAGTHGVEQNTVTALSADEEKGTVRMIGRTISATPAEGYYASGCTVTPEGACTVKQEGNLFHVSDVKQDCTVTVAFAAKPAAEVAFSVPDGISVTGGTTASSFVGNEILLPEISGTVSDATHDYSFLGWTVMPVETAAETPSDLMLPGEAFYVSKEKQTLYALFYYKEADASSTDKEYAQVTEAPADWEGVYCVVASDYDRIMTNELSKTYLKDAYIEVDHGSVKNPAENCLFQLETAPTAGYYYLCDMQSNYVGCIGAKKLTISAEADLADTTYLWKPTLQGLIPYRDSNGVLQYNSSAPRFTTYTSNLGAAYLYAPATPTKTVYTSAQGHVHVFKEVTTPATCTEDGKIVRTCTLCGEVFTEVLKATGHRESLKETVSATCKKDGHRLYVCTVCGAERKETIAKFACPSLAYGDLPADSWYHDDVDAILLKNLMNGVGNNAFDPEGTLTRAMVVTILHRVAGTPKAAVAHSFQDVADGQWYSEAVAWAAEQKIVLGMSETVFAPHEPITREQLSAILFRYARANYLDTSVLADLAKFTDAKTVSEYAVTPMRWAVGTGIVNGVAESDGVAYLRPQSHSTRAQVATMLNRFLTLADRPCPHQYDAATTQPTCTETGKTVYTCRLCGHSYAETLEALGHSWGEWTLAKEPTAESEGEEQRVCAVCQETERRAVAKLTYTLTKTDTLKAGDQIVLVCPSGNAIMSAEEFTGPYIRRLKGAEVKLEDGKLNRLPDGAALLTVGINEKGEYTFQMDGKYLVCSNGSGSLYFTELPSFSNWVLEAKDGGWMIRSAEAVKMLNGTPTPVYVEYYNDNFTSYYFKENTTDFSAFTFAFYRYDKVQ